MGMGSSTCGKAAKRESDCQRSKRAPQGGKLPRPQSLLGLNYGGLEALNKGLEA
jgi:hypothetical protein